MKRILGNIWLQLFLGLIVGIIGVIVAYPLAILFYLKYAGFELFFDTGASGDHSPITFAIAVIFGIIAITFPTLIWFFLHRFGNLKSASVVIRAVTFIIFATLLLSVYFGRGTFEKVQTAYKDYRSVRDACIVKNGINKKTTGEFTQEFECKNGVYNGFTRTYNSKGILVSEGTFLNGRLNGTGTSYYDSGKVRSITTYKDGDKEGLEVNYNEDGSTNFYVMNSQGKAHSVYFQSAEILGHLDGYLDLKTQNYFCEHRGEPSFKYYSYTCLNNVINSEFIWYDPKGNVLERENFINGVPDGTYEEFKSGKLFIHLEFKNGRLDGIYEQYSDGKVFKHLEFKNGKLDGKIQQYSPGGALEYEGQYKDGLQEGIFRRYGYEGIFVSEVVFEHGKIVKINQ